MRAGWNRHRQDWTCEEEHLLAERLRAGMTIAEVARELERSQGAVHTKARNLDLLIKRGPRAVARNNGRRSASFFLS